MLTRRYVMCTVCLVLLVTAGIGLAGSKIDGWVIDDFESYSSTADMKASGFGTGGPWWILQELQVALGMITIPPGTNLSIELVQDPNAYVANGTPDDPNNPGQGVEIHYDITSGISCDLFRFTNTMGIPYDLIATGMPAPLDYLPIADFTQYDKLSFKVMNLPGNDQGNTNNFTVALVGPDTKAIGNYRWSTEDGNCFEYPENVWMIVELDLKNGMEPGDSSFGPDMVSGITLGTYDRGGTYVTYIIDDIMLSNQSVPCPDYSPADVNLDCSVNLEDLMALTLDWLSL